MFVVFKTTYAPTAAKKAGILIKTRMRTKLYGTKMTFIKEKSSECSPFTHGKFINESKTLTSCHSIRFCFGYFCRTIWKARRRDKIEHRLKIQIAYLEKIGSFGVMKGLEIKLTYSEWMLRKIVLISFSRNAELRESTTRMNLIFVFVM